MKKAINIWSFPAEKTLKECFQIAKSAGFMGIEPALADTGACSLESSETEMQEIQKLASDMDINLTSLACGAYWTYSLTANDSQQRIKAFDIAKKQIELAAALGVDTVLVIPGAVGVDFIPNYEVVPYDVAYDRALEAFNRLAPIAQQHNVNIGVENVWNKFLISPLEMRHFLDTIDSPFVGAYLDVGNVVLNGYPEQWIRILNKRIKKVHFKDYRRQAGGLHGFVDLLAGDVNYPAVVEALQDIAYTDYVIAEMIPPYNQYPEQLIYNTASSMDRILGNLRRNEQ
jgi:L-ribulose-5-phosphate 3-epimerase